MDLRFRVHLKEKGFGSRVSFIVPHGDIWGVGPGMTMENQSRLFKVQTSCCGRGLWIWKLGKKSYRGRAKLYTRIMLRAKERTCCNLTPEQT